jgi:MFS family permease
MRDADESSDGSAAPGTVGPRPGKPGGDGPTSRSLLPLYAGHSLLHLLLGIYPAVLLLLRETFAADYTTLGAIFTAATFIYGVGSVPAGFLVNRIHPMLLVRVFLLVAAAATAVAAAAGGTWVLAAGLLLLGLAASPYHACALTLLSRASGNDPRLIAHQGMAGSVGLALAPAFAALLAAAVSWRLPFVCGCAMAVAIFLWTLTMPKIPNQTVSTAMARSHLAHGSTHVGALALVFAVTVALGFVFRGFATFLPALAAQRADLFAASGLVSGGLLASLVYAVGFFGQWSVTRLRSRRDIERSYVALLVAQVVTLSLAAATSDWLLIAALMAFSFCHFTTQPVDNILTGKYTSLSLRGVGYGLSFGLSFGAGSFAAWAGGAVADASGGSVQPVFVMLAGAALVAALTASVLWFVARRLRE